MNYNKDDIDRNRPAEEGRNNDPHVRDESAQQPGVNTMSDSETDPSNQSVTQTALDPIHTSDFGKDADKTFDEVGDADKGD